MKSQGMQVTMVELRKNARKFITRLSEGLPFELTYRGRTVATVNPVLTKSRSDASDPIYGLSEDAVRSGGPALSARKADKLIYGA